MADKRRLGARLRAWLRPLHRDIGYLLVGLTFVYALSGLAVNHLEDWDPNFVAVERTHALPQGLPADPQAAAARVLAELGVEGPPEDVYAVDSAHLEIVVGDSTFFADLRAGEVLEHTRRERALLRAANWLHLNRGKRAWTYVADGYAVLLLALAVSGLFMLPGRKGVKGRGAVIAGLGAAIPVAYVLLSGGP